MMTPLLFIAFATIGQTAPPAPQPQLPQPPDCQRLLAAEPRPGVAPLCQAEDAMRARRLGEAAALYGRAAELLNDLDLKIYAYEAIVRVHGDTHLNAPAAVEQALRQLATLVAGTPAPLMRLAKFQETHDGIDRAELTLLGARQQYPESHPLLSELSAFFARRVMAMQRSRTAETGGPAESPASGEEPAYRPDCQQFSFGHPASGLAQLCAAEATMRQAAVPPKKPADPAERARAADARKERLRTAAEHYARAASLLDEIAPKVFAYDALARVYGRTNLNEPRLAEQAIRQVIALRPSATEPIVRLAAIQEEQKLVDAAETTLLSARQQFPEDVEPLKALSRFYARLATAAAMAENRRERDAEPPRAPGMPDENGFYSIGGTVPPPKKERDVRPSFPKAAMAVGLDGIVIFELFLDETGAVIDARPTRPIPMLDEAAMAAVKQWRFEPTIVDGRPVPARMTVTVNFTLKKQ